MGRAWRNRTLSRRYWKSVEADAGMTHCFSAAGKGRNLGSPCLMMTCRAAQRMRAKTLSRNR